MMNRNASEPQHASVPAYVLSLTECRAAHLHIVGGKAANLGELIAAELPVPSGFVVTTGGYDRIVTQNDLSQIIAQVLPGTSGDDQNGHGAAIRTAFENSPIPQDLAQAIVGGYQQLGEGAVAVRSSATAEDLPGMTFAGQQESYLNVVGADAVLDAVRRCWASLWSDRAIAYRRHQQIDQTTIKLAVVVQRMVAAEVAGVMFTANPITGERGEIVIDANPGLGEAVVAGLVTPDHFVLDKISRQVRERTLGRRETIVRMQAPGGTQQVTESTDAAIAASLDDSALAQLAQLGVAIEHHFGTPQDIEWAWANNTFFIVQARPMTALPEPLPTPSKIVQLQTATLAELFAVRPYPLDLHTWLDSVSAAAFAPIFNVLGFSVPPLQHMFRQEDGVLLAFDHTIHPSPTWQVLLAPARLAALAIRHNPAHASHDPMVEAARARAREIEARQFQSLDWQQLLSTVREVVSLAQPLTGDVRRNYFPRAALAAGFLRLFLALLREGNRFGTLLSGVESATLESNRQLEQLARQVRANPILADLFTKHDTTQLLAALECEPASRDFRQQLRVFLDRYGHRDVVISTALQPTWKDAPELVLGLLKGLAQSDAHLPEGEESTAWKDARDTVLAHPLLRPVPLRSLFLKLLGAARTLWVLRENSHYDLTRILPGLRRALIEMGRRLAAVDALDAPEMVFHLLFEELAQIDGWPPPPVVRAELQANAVRRQANRQNIDHKPLIDPRLYRRANDDDSTTLRGFAGSPGVAEGTVCVIRSSSEFDKLRAGEVLVAPFTNPSWTPLFQRACAVVVDGGSVASHAAIVAREYGIPAVMGTVDGTQRLVDGQHVRVDGHQGQVTLLSTTNVETL